VDLQSVSVYLIERKKLALEHLLVKQKYILFAAKNELQGIFVTESLSQMN
jgi:hypothetical protein